MAKNLAPSIVWFRDDLRLGDHPALIAGAKADAPLICVYVLDEDSAGFRAHGGASRWWLAQSLRALDADLRKLGQRLVLRRGKAADVDPGARCARPAHTRSTGTGATTVPVSRPTTR